MTPKDKEPYDKKAKEDKERYEREKEEYAVRLPIPLCHQSLPYLLTTRTRALPRKMRTMNKGVLTVHYTVTTTLPALTYDHAHK